MAVTAVPGCLKARDAHRHVTCWNCGADHCLGVSMQSYTCACGCAEGRYAVMKEPDPEFDVDFAASRSSPA